MRLWVSRSETGFFGSSSADVAIFNFFSCFSATFLFFGLFSSLWALNLHCGLPHVLLRNRHLACVWRVWAFRVKLGRFLHSLPHMNILERTSYIIVWRQYLLLVEQSGCNTNLVVFGEAAALHGLKRRKNATKLPNLFRVLHASCNGL